MSLSFDAEEARIRDAYSRRGRDDRYSWFNRGHLFFIQERERDVIATLTREGLSSLKAVSILEVGCGTGYWLRQFIKWGARPQNVTGIDLLPDRVAEAKELCPRDVRILCASVTEIPLPSESYDLVVQSTVFTSILDRDAKQCAAAEMIRVVKRSGVILWYDFYVNSPLNSNVRGITKRELKELFAGCQIHFRRVTLAPPLSRMLAPYSWLACCLLSYLPWLRTHYLCVIRRQD